MAIWLVAVRSVLINLLYCTFKDGVFKNAFELKVVTKRNDVLCQFISQLSYRCNFKANSVVLEKIYLLLLVVIFT